MPVLFAVLLCLISAGLGFGLGLAACNRSWQQHNAAPPRHGGR